MSAGHGAARDAGSGCAVNTPETPVYLDHAATTPVRPEALDAWVETTRRLSERPGNPNAVHAGGRAAKRMLEDAREQLASALGADRAEVIFTSGATESASLGVIGAALGVVAQPGGRRDAGARSGPDDLSPSPGSRRLTGADSVADGSSLPPELRRGVAAPSADAFLPAGRPRIVVSGIEHPAVAEQRERAVASGFDWLVLPTSHDGVAELDDAAFAGDSSGHKTVLASLAMVCSETAVVQPVEQLVALGAEYGFLVHSDATQAVGNALPSPQSQGFHALDFHTLGLDLMTVGGHKFGAPVGTGALLVKRGVKITSDRPGGGQERQIRSGTQDVAGAVALAVAAEQAVAEVNRRAAGHSTLREQLLAGLPPGVRLTALAQTVPSIVHLSLPTRHPEAVLLELDRAGILASAGSACHAGVTRPSAVLLQMGRSEDEALGVLRVSFGRDSSSSDVAALLAALPSAVDAGQRMDAFDSGR